VSHWLETFISNYEYWGVFFLMLLENIFPPIPSEVVLPMAGFIAASQELNSWLMLIFASLGAAVGAAFWYWVGLWVGKPRLITFFNKWGPWVAVTTKEFEKTVHFFDQHAKKSILIGRIIPGVRTLISIPAGLIKMPFIQFMLYTFIGSFIWSAGLIYAGFILGAQFASAANLMGYISNTLLSVIIIIYCVKIFRFHCIQTKDQ